MKKNRDFFKLSEPYDTITDIADLRKRLQNPVIENLLYEPNELTSRELGHQYKIQDKTFRNVSFAKTLLRGLNFQRCLFEDCLFIGSEIDDCEFHKCSFVGTNTYKFKLNETYIDPKSFCRSAFREEHQNVGVDMFQELMKNSRRLDQPTFESSATYHFRKWSRFQTLYELKSPNQSSKEKLDLRFKAAMNWLWEYLLGYGVRLRNFLCFAFILIVFFSLINFLFRAQLGLVSDEGGVKNAVDALYYTVISMTTIGYGDISPATSAGRIVMSIEGVIGFSMFAIFASIMFRKVAP